MLSLSISLLDSGSLAARRVGNFWVDAEASTLAHDEQVPVSLGAAVDPGRSAFGQRIQDEPEAAPAPPSQGPASPGYWRRGKCWPAGEVQCGLGLPGFPLVAVAAFLVSMVYR